MFFPPISKKSRIFASDFKTVKVMIIQYICPILLYAIGLVLFLRNISRLTTWEGYFDKENIGISASYGLYGSANIMLMRTLIGPYGGWGDLSLRIIVSLLIAFGINALIFDIMFRSKMLPRKKSEHKESEPNNKNIH